jgi:hypothetical protein
VGNQACVTGSVSNMVFDATSKTWGWSCNGLNGGSAVSCSTNVSCGTKNGTTTYNFDPNDTANFCSA